MVAKYPTTTWLKIDPCISPLIPALHGKTPSFKKDGAVKAGDYIH